MQTDNQGLQYLSDVELDDVLTRGRAEKWNKLALVKTGRTTGLSQRAGARTYCLHEPIGHRLSKLVAIRSLTSLDLSGNAIGDEGARALARLEGLTSLYLSGNEIGSRGAAALASLTGLTALDLGRNAIGDQGASALAALTSLTSLYLGGNGLRAVPMHALLALGKLTTLDLGGNEVGSEGARALASLTGLTSLYLGDNAVGAAGARALAALTQLTALDLSANGIGTDGAEALRDLKALTHLYLRGNSIRGNAARCLAALDKLTSLYLGYNALGDDGARALTSLTGLTTLDLSANGIRAPGARALLDAWCDDPRISSLRRLDLRRNIDLESVLPPEIITSVDAQATLAAYRSFRDAGRRKTLRPLNEAKLLVVGNEAVGKTSLIRYLTANAPRDPDEKKTPGTSIHEKIDVSKWSVTNSQVRLNVWDFGGQEIMRGTHRFFLTERSLYLLVLEDRREDDKSIYEWLEIIAQRGGDSPVIIVINKCDSDILQRHLDEAELRRTYPVIAGFARTSCNANETAAISIAVLRAQIADVLSTSVRLKHVRDPIPLSWLRIKDAVSELAQARSVLPVREFERLCEGDADTPTVDRITDPNMQRAILALLNDLGVVIAYGLRRDASAVAREVTVLDPNWLTGAIYALINSPRVRDQGGELRHEEVGEILEPKTYHAQWHDLIISMMQEPALGLCLAIADPHSRRYLLPDALPTKEPDYGMWPPDSLRFRFKYDSLPKDLIPRFIVAAHRSMTSKPTWWRSGVVVTAEGCRLLVRTDVAASTVEIYVAGTAGRRAALSVARSYFDAVHGYYAKLAVEARVPLPDQPDVDVGYEHLVTLEREEGPSYAYRPERANRKYAVQELLEGVREPGSRAHRRRSEERANASVDDSAVYQVSSLPDGSDDTALRKLRRTYAGPWGAKVFWLAAVTLAPQLLALKLHEIRLNLCFSTLIFVAYHALGIWIFFDVKTIDLPGRYFGDECATAVESCRRRARVHAAMGHIVLVLLVVTFLARAELEYGAWHGKLLLPDFVYALVGVAPG